MTDSKLKGVVLVAVLVSLLAGAYQLNGLVKEINKRQLAQLKILKDWKVK